MSTVTKGMHMIPLLNLSQTECAVFGNHEFDFGIDNLQSFVKQTKFPWLMSNVIDKETNKALGDGEIFHIIERNGIKIGLIGVVEEEWLSTLATLARDDLIFIDYVKESKRLAKQLREEFNCDIIIALTHMRYKNDIELANKVDEIDLFLGGHDHAYCKLEVNSKIILKSGTDFREFSVLDLDVNLLTKKIDKTDIQKIDVVSTKFAENEELKKELDQYKHLIEASLDKVIANFEVELEGRFSYVRTSETNLGNFVTDVIRTATKTDCVLLNSGTLRSDMLHKKGAFKLRDLFRILPAQYPLIVLEVNGRTIWKALENGVSQFPKYEGRFPQVSGISFAFDPNRSPGERIDPTLIKIGDEYLNFDQTYKLATKVYLSKGRDGYECLSNSKVLIGEEECVDLLVTVQNYFDAINKILKGDSHSHHRLSLVSTSERKHSMSKDDHSLDHNMNLDSTRSLTIKSINEIELEKCKLALAPKVEGRIVQITSDDVCFF